MVGLSVGCDDDREIPILNPGDDTGNIGGVVDSPDGGDDGGNGSGGDLNVPEEDDGNEGVGGFSETINGIVVTWAADITRKQMIVLTGMIQNMVTVEDGTFQMGSDESGTYENEKPAHSVTLSGFLIGKYEVTQCEWETVMESNPSHFEGDSLPVESVSWEIIDEQFLPKLNLMTGLSFRLPTEAEWEYAARGGRYSKGYIYSGSNNVESVAWSKSNGSNKTHPVGQTVGNELGLHDMSGNVWEWCYDRLRAYKSSSQTNPVIKLGEGRVRRGGSWRNETWACRTLYRDYSDPWDAYDNIGLRLVLPL